MSYEHKFKPSFLSLILQSGIFSCGVDDTLTDSAKCETRDLSEAAPTICQDLKIPASNYLTQLSEGCEESGGVYTQSSSCDVASGTIGCSRELRVSGFYVVSTSWFQGIADISMLDQKTIESCEMNGAKWVRK